MIIEIKRFGNILSSRPEGREAALILLANELRNVNGKIELDFKDVLVMTPSWLSEFVNTLRPQIPTIHFLDSQNASVIGSIQIIRKMDQG